MNVSTGVKDVNLEYINLGDWVRRTDGFEGRVVFQHGAFRVDFGMDLLKYNSSLLFTEGGEARFKIIKG